MTVSEDEALSIFTKWANEGSSIRMQLRFAGLNGFFTGKILTAIPSLITMVPLGAIPEDGPQSLITALLAVPHSFSFVDPRDGNREVLSVEMSFGVIVSFLNGETLMLYELPSD